MTFRRFNSRMLVAQGFLSYVHEDNRVEGGRIADLAQDMQDQYRLLTTHPFDLFRDKDDLRWGEDWKLRIDEVLAQATFFIPVITPTYFERPECRRELDLFARHARARGVAALVMPIIWVDFPALRADPCQDELIGLVRSFAWEDWTALRFADRGSAEYRRAVAGLAGRLADAAAEAERVPLPPPEDDAPGYLDVLATTEETLPAWVKTTAMIEAKLTEVGVIMQVVSRPTRVTDGTTAATLLTDALAAPVADLHRLANEFLVLLHEVDQGVRVITGQAGQVVEGNPDLGDPIAEFTEDLRGLVVEEVRRLGEAEELIELAADVERLTRTLRPIARELRLSLTLLADGRDLMTTWAALLDRLPPSLGGR